MAGLLIYLGVDVPTAAVVTAVVRLTTLWFGVLIGVGCAGAAVRLVR